jgi:hypothetical protein
MAPHNIMAQAQTLLVVGCLCRFAVCTWQGMGLGCAKEQYNLLMGSHPANKYSRPPLTKFFPGFILPRA